MPGLNICLVMLFKKYAIAFIVAALLILNPVLISFSTQPMRENNYLFFQGLMFCFLIASVKKIGMISSALCGLFCIISVFCRYEAIETLFLCPLIFYLVLRHNKLKVKNFWRFVTIFLLSAFTGCIFLLHMTVRHRILFRIFEKILILRNRMRYTKREVKYNAAYRT